MDLNDFFVSLAALVPLILSISDFLIRLFKFEKGIPRQITSWVVSLAICGTGAALEVGFLTGATIPQVVLYGLAAGLLTNGIFDISLIQTVLDYIFKFLPKKEQEPEPTE